MVKCCIIYYSIYSYGVRSLVAYLRKHTNSEIKLLLFPLPHWSKFPDHVVEQVVKECDGFDIVGFSVLSNLDIPTNQISEALKNRVGAKVIYGGIHPTVCPEQCLKYADAVCVGEGEEAMAELVNRYDKERVIANDIKNIYVKDKAGNMIKNAPRPLITDLDKIPLLHFWQTEEKIFHNGFFRDATASLYKFYTIDQNYMTFATRGCVFHCTYCCNNSLKRIYEGQKLFHRRSLDSLFAELHHAREALPFLKGIALYDDLFFAISVEDMKAFCSRYKKEVNMPLVIYGLHPSLVTAEKIKLAVDAGLVKLRMGIQSGCQSTLKLYERSTKVEEITKAANILHEYAKGVSISYDFISDNPFEKEEDVKATLRFIGGLPKPFALNLFSLVFYPGTRLYDMGIEKGLLITDEDRGQAFRKNFFPLDPGYYNDLFKIISRFKLPSKIWDILLERKLGYRVWHKLLLLGARFAFTQEMFTTGIRCISSGQFKRIFHFFVGKPNIGNYG